MDPFREGSYLNGNKISKNAFATVEIDLTTGYGTAPLPIGFDRFYTTIAGFRARNKMGGMYSNYTDAVKVYTGDDGVIASSSGNFAGENARVWVVLMNS